mmetsp:Transcript_32348/g.47473  ORF Transcript_32348/g.47473 Transcript_32348/m.47473 type:complete len:414 (-) Transcript_32348:102-1343(-)
MMTMYRGPIFQQLLDWIKRNDRAMHTINLRNKSVNDDDVVSLADALLQNISITHIDLSRNRIGDRGAIALATVLKHSPKLIELRLGMNEIGPIGARYLADALKDDVCRMKYLHLVGNDVGVEGAKAFAEALEENSHLEKLGLEQNAIENDGACALGVALIRNNSLAKLELGGNDIGPIGADALAKGLRHNHRLGVLGLAGNDIQDEGATFIAEALRLNDTLFWLCLGRNQIGAHGAKSIADAIYDDRSPQHIFDSNHHIEQIYGISDEELKKCIRWNKGGVAETRRRKLSHFLSDHPDYCLKVDLDLKCIPTLLYKIGKECSMDVMFRHLREMPDLFGDVSLSSNAGKAVVGSSPSLLDQHKKVAGSRKWRRFGDVEKNKVDFDITLSLNTAEPRNHSKCKKYRRKQKARWKE